MRVFSLLLAALGLGAFLFFFWSTNSTTVTLYLCNEKGDPVVGKDVLFVRKEYEVVLAIKKTDRQGRIIVKNMPFGTLSILERPVRPQREGEVTISPKPRRIAEVNLLRGTFDHQVGSPCNESQR